jgi:RNA polymerase sigma-70 factor (ECF subfamily)
MVKDHSTTEDMIQASFLKVIGHVPDVDSEAKLKGWIKVVVRNTVYNYFRKTKKNRNEVSSDSVYLDEAVVQVKDNFSTEDEVELKMMSETISQCLKELKPEYQALIELRWKRELSYKEIAEQLDLTEDKVKYKLHRAREAVKKRFLRRWEEPDEQSGS